MQDESFIGEALEKALVNDELSQPGLGLFGMVKASDQKGHVSFTGSGCDDWVDIPTKMGDEEFQRQDPLRLGSEEFGPARAVPARRRDDPGVSEDLP